MSKPDFFKTRQRFHDLGGLGIDLGSLDLPDVSLGGDAGIGIDLGSVDVPAIDLGGTSRDLSQLTICEFWLLSGRYWSGHWRS